MPNPKRKHTPHRRDCRRMANSKLKYPNLSKCSNCGFVKIPHNVCLKCGFYNNESIIVVKKENKNFKQYGNKKVGKQ
ncbi:MAG: 50S ribosomal protein L32 [Endomicrobium sp.]|jgi:large subunit ribosomal protein L32|nr:50S ribosomal protein L32 [Endomicrobium sp.]